MYIGSNIELAISSDRFFDLCTLNVGLAGYSVNTRWGWYCLSLGCSIVNLFSILLVVFDYEYSNTGQYSRVASYYIQCNKT